MYKLVDYVTKKTVETKNLVFTGDDSPWEVVMDLNLVKSKLNMEYFKTVSPSLCKYLPLMPIQKVSEFISLRENATPLVKSKVVGKQVGCDLYFKLESKNPTGSFKDRGSAVEVAVARELGAKAIILASTGNMAASCAYYASAAKMACYIVVPERVSAAKLAQATAFGGKLIQIKGSYNDAAELAKARAEKEGLYLAGDYAFRVEGQKTAAYELIDQLHFNSPDYVVIPIGCGTNIAAYYKGFHEYAQLGLINNLPQLIGVQAEEENTVATAIAVKNPIDWLKAVDAITSTEGELIKVSDQEILHAHYLLSSEEGLFVETASAATVAGLLKTAQNQKYANKKIICVLTGDGLKESRV